MNKVIRMLIAAIGLAAVVLYMLHFFEVIQHEYIPIMAGVTILLVYIFGVYAQKKDQKQDDH